MKLNSLALLALLLLCGCQGETPQQKREREKRENEQTVSALNVAADLWDGTNHTPDVSNHKDTWGNPIRTRITKGSLNYCLEVYSSGPDGLPLNDDDVVVIRKVRHGDNSVNKEVEKAGTSLFKGITKGIRQGWREGGDPDKP